jgi:DNA-binding transcriptional LysR family regulator
VQALERRLGTRVFDRGRGGVAPTATGRVLLERAQGLLKQAADVEREISLLIGRSAGHLRIGAGPYAAAISIGSAVARLVTAHPGLSVDVQVGDWDLLTERVLDGDLDLAVVEQPASQQDARLHSEPLPRHPGRYFCRRDHPLSRLAAPAPADVEAYPLAMTLLPERLKHVALRKREGRAEIARKDGVLPWINVNTFDLARQIVLESDAIGLATPGQIADDLAAGRLTILDVDIPGIHSNYGIVTLAGRTPSPAAEAFMEILRGIEAAVASANETTRPGMRAAIHEKLNDGQVGG